MNREILMLSKWFLSHKLTSSQNPSLNVTEIEFGCKTRLPTLSGRFMSTWHRL